MYLPNHGLALLLGSMAALAVAVGVTAPLPGAAQEVDAPLYLPGEEVRRPGAGLQLVQASSLVRAPQARTTFSVNGAGLACAVIDSGARLTHIDFPAGKIVAKRNFTTDDGGNPDLVTDGNGHGSNVAGTIAAKSSLHTGIAPAAGLVILKASTNAGVVSRQAQSDALQWVLENHAAFNISVVNMSISDTGNHASEAVSPGDSFGIASKIAELTTRGVAIVISVGNKFKPFNSVQGMSWPAILHDAISVGGVFDSNVGRDTLEGATATSSGPNRIVPWSQRLHESVNATDRTDIFAPGALMKSTGKGSNTAESIFHGTSQAAPVVCGIVLLLQQAAKRRGVTPTVAQLEGWLRRGAVSITDGDDEADNVINTGKVFLRADALGALRQLARDLDGPVLTDCNTTPRTFTSAGGTVAFSVKATDTGGVASVVAGLTGAATTDVPLALSGGFYRGSFTAPANTVAAVRTYTVKYRAADHDGNTASTDCGAFTVAGRSGPILLVTGSLTGVPLMGQGSLNIQNIGSGMLEAKLQATPAGRVDIAPYSAILLAGETETVSVKGLTPGSFTVTIESNAGTQTRQGTVK